MGLPTVLLVVAGLLILVSPVQRLAARVNLPASILFAVLGIVIGAAAILVLQTEPGGFMGRLAGRIVDLPVSADVLLYIFLPALLFQSALTADVRRMLDDAAPIFLLAVVAVLIATFVIGFAVWPVAGVSLVAALLLGSMVGTTDSVAVIAIFRDVGAPARLTRLVEGESLLNDAAAIMMFSVLMGVLLGGETTTVGGASLSLVWRLAGGVGAGYVGTRLVVSVLPWFQDLRLAQVTLTLALPYLVFILGERTFEVSGVVAAVTSGLMMSLVGPPRIAPRDWQFLNDVWEQLAYWASSLVFVMAALRVPLLLTNVGWSDVVVLAVHVVAALIARALVLFGFFPVLTALKLTQRIGFRYNVVILWGGLRGAVTLALALAVMENDLIDPSIRRFIAVQATGLTLFTLLVSGLTLRPLIRLLGLDRLSALDQTLRAHVLHLARGRVAGAARQTGEQYRLPADLVGKVASSYAPPDAAAAIVAEAESVGTDEDRLRLGLAALVQREREVVLAHFDARTMSGRTVQQLLANVGLLLEGASTRGTQGYLSAAAHIAGFSRRFRFAHQLHRRLHIDGPLVDELGNRFERLLVARIVLDELGVYIDATLAPLVGTRLTPKIHEALQQRQQLTAAAFEALVAQYPSYAAMLQERLLRRVALRHEDSEYRTLFGARVIGPELFSALQRDLQMVRSTIDARPRLDLGLETRALLSRVPMFASLPVDALDKIAHLLRPRLAVPGERLISVGDPGDSMSFISSGVVEVDTPGPSQKILLTNGDFFGEMALLLHQPRQADVNVLSYCQLLVLEARDFESLLRSSRAIRAQIDREGAARARMNQENAGKG